MRHPKHCSTDSIATLRTLYAEYIDEDLPILNFNECVFSVYSDACMHFRELIGKARSRCQCYLPLAYSESTVISLSVNLGECKCCDSHNPLCFIFPTGEYCPSQLSEAWHIRHDDRVPISLLSRPVLPILSVSFSTGMYLNEKFSWSNLVISCSVFFQTQRPAGANISFASLL